MIDSSPSPAATTTSGDDSGAPFVLPAKLWWLYSIGPLLLAPTVVPQFFLRPLRQQLSLVASFYLAFFAVGAALHLAYARLQPRRLSRNHRLWILLGLHALFTAAVVIPTALAIQPLYCLVNYGTPTPAEIQYCLVGITKVQRLEFLWIGLVVSWGSVLPAVMLHALRRERDAIERRLYEERRQHLVAQLQNLQARLQPHFLFNSLNTIACLISEDPAKAEHVVERLADLLRACLTDLDRTVVPLGDELSVVRAYLEVQAARFGTRLRFVIDCPAELLSQPVPPLCLQPVVENAVLHGAVAQRRGGEVEVRAMRSGDQLVLSVQDDGPGPGRSTHRGSGTALPGLRERLRILYPDLDPPASLELQTPSDRPGCLAVLRLPLTAQHGT